MGRLRKSKWDELLPFAREWAELGLSVDEIRRRAKEKFDVELTKHAVYHKASAEGFHIRRDEKRSWVKRRAHRRPSARGRVEDEGLEDLPDLASRYMELRGLEVVEREAERHFSDEELLDLFARPGGFFKEVLGMELLVGRDGTPWQKQFVEAVLKHNQVCWISGRQMGKSKLVCGINTYFALTEANYTGCIVSPTQRQADLNKRFLRDFFYRYRCLQRAVVSDKKELFELPNNSFIYTWPGGNPEFLRGLAQADIFLDEGCFMKPEVWGAVNAARAVGGHRLVVTSTPWGMSEESPVWRVWKRWSDAPVEERAATKASWECMMFLTEINPLVPLDWLEAQRELDPVSFGTEFEGRWIDETNAWFPTAMILGAAEDYQFHVRAEDGWEYFVGVDPGHVADYSAVVVVGRPKGGRVLYLVTIMVAKGWEENVVELVNRAITQFSPQKVAVDARSHGYAKMIEDLFPQVYRYVSTPESDEMGRTTGYERLKILLSKGELRIPARGTCREAAMLHREISNISYMLTRGTGKAQINHPEVGYDDICDALSYAVYVAQKPVSWFDRAGLIGVKAPDFVPSEKMQEVQ